MTMNQNNSNGDPVDKLLSAYYRAEMPSPWPAAPRPWAETSPATTSTGHPASRSRWALAASVAILLGGCWYLSERVTDGRAKKGMDLGDGPTANVKNLKDLAHPKGGPAKTP